MVPVSGMSAGALTVFSGVLSAGASAQALHEAARAGKVRASDLPEMIASVWTRDDSPTTGLSEAGWMELWHRESQLIADRAGGKREIRDYQDT